MSFKSLDLKTQVVLLMSMLMCRLFSIWTALFPSWYDHPQHKSWHYLRKKNDDLESTYILPENCVLKWALYTFEALVICQAPWKKTQSAFNRIMLPNCYLLLTSVFPTQTSFSNYKVGFPMNKWCPHVALELQQVQQWTHCLHTPHPTYLMILLFHSI